MSSIYRYIIIITAITLLGCGEKKSDENADQQKTAARSDTTERKQPQAPEGLPPNAAHISGTVVSVHSQDESNDIKLKFRIDKIIGYGPSTKPLSEGRSLSLSSTDRFLKQRNRSLQAGDSLRIIVTQTMTMGKQKSTWRIVDFK